MWHSFRYIFLLAATLVLPIGLFGQVRFYTELESRDVVAGEAFQVGFSAENGQVSDFRPPDWNGLEVLQGPSRSMQSTFINGQMSSKTSFIFLVSAPKPGSYNLGAASVKVDGREMKTEAIRITAREGSRPKPGQAGDGTSYFIVASLDTNVAWVGQQVILEYKLYTRVEINSYDILKAPSFQGLYYRGLPQFQLNTQRETLDGVSYYTRVLRRIAVFPQQSGKVVIEPMVFQLGVVEQDKRSRSLFFSSRIRPVQLATDPLELTVQRLPEPVPGDFCGAVGALGMSVQWDKTRLSTDDAISLRLTLSGDSDPKQLVPPPLDPGPSFEAYPPNLVDEQTSETSGRALVTKVWEYVLVPRQPGQFRLPLRLSYFDPDSARYLDKSTDPWAITVVKGTGQALRDAERTAERPEQMHTPDLISAHHPHPRFWWASLWFWMLCAIPVTAGVVIGRIHFLREKEMRSSPEDRRYRKARKEAQMLLDEARRHLEADDRQGFYDAASKAFLGYAANRLKVSANSVRREDMRIHLRQAGIPEATIDGFIQYWDLLDAARYAPVANAFPLRELYDKAIRLVSELEATLEKI